MRVESLQTSSPEWVGGSGPKTTAGFNFWVQDAKVNGTRKAIIHLGSCPLCDEGSSGNSNPSLREWYGPFSNLESARRISDGLSEIAMRSECRCVRNADAQITVRAALLNEPLAVRKHETVKKKEQNLSAEIAAAAAAAEEAVTRSASEPARKANKTVLYSALGVSAAFVIAATVFLFPALSVVEASNHADPAPFVLANDIPLAVTDLNADCSLTFGPTSAHLKDSHTQVTERLGSKSAVSVPCFQTGGGAVPQTGGVTLQVSVNYAVLGVRHVQQTFSFVAARTKDGFCRWVKKD